MSEGALAPLPPSFRHMVRGRLRERATRAGLDGLLLLKSANVAYATGWRFSVNERPIGLWIPTAPSGPHDALLLIPELERENAEDVPGVGVECYEEFPGVRPPGLWMLEQTGAQRVAIDQLDAAYLDDARALVQQLDLVDHAALERAVKHPEELVLIREAARFADQVLERLLAVGGDIIAQGGTEADLMADCTAHVRTLLAERHGDAFQNTKMGITASVHSGPRAALPHGAVLSRQPRPGEPVIAGIGCSLGGYHAESGVTLVVGEIAPEQRRVMDVMAEAGAATVDALERGLPCSEVNEAALEVVGRAGLGDTIRHRIGHGMGVEGHEAPWLAPGDSTRTEPGMVFSCEPGIYRPGIDGWRTIDTLIVGASSSDMHKVEVASGFLRSHPPEARILAV